MDRWTLTGAEIGRFGRAHYEKTIRACVETLDNIGKIAVIDVETGDYEVDDEGLASADKLHARRPGAALYGIRIGYNVA